MVHEEAEAASRVEAQVQSKLASRHRASKQKLQHLSDFAHALADGEKDSRLLQAYEQQLASMVAVRDSLQASCHKPYVGLVLSC